MKLSTTVGKLLDAFNITSPTIDSKGITANLYMYANEASKSLYLYSTNMLAETATRLLVEEIESPGEVLINAARLIACLQGIAKESKVSMNLVDSNLKVVCGNVKLNIPTSTGTKEMGDRLRSIPKTGTKENFSMPVTELLEFANRSEFCIPNDETGQRAILSVLKLTTEKDREEGFATDGSIAVHIASSKKQGKGEGLNSELLIPAAALASLKSILSKRKHGETVGILVNKNKVIFRCSDGTHFGVLVPGLQYPQLRMIVDQTASYTVNAPKEDLKKALARAASVLSWSDNKKTLELKMTAESIIINACGSYNLTDTIPVSYVKDKPAKDVRLGVNVDYLLSIVNGSNSEKLAIGFSSDDKPLIVTDKCNPDDDEQIDIKYVVMGVKLGAEK